MTTSDRRLGIILIVPALLLIFGLVLYPFLYNFWLSFQSLSSRNPLGGFIGLENYAKIFNNPDYLRVTIKTFIWTAGVVGGQVVVGFGIALLLNQPFRGLGLIRSFMRLITILEESTSPRGSSERRQHRLTKQVSSDLMTCRQQHLQVPQRSRLVQKRK